MSSIAVNTRKPILLTLAVLPLLLYGIPAAGASSLFGFSVAISDDVMVVGDPGATVGGNASQGAVYVYQNNSNVWTQVAELTADDGEAGDLFGSSVQIFNNAVVVGAPGWSAGAGEGAAYIFIKPLSGWSSNSFTAELTASDGAPGNHFGTSVAISSNMAVVGAPGPAPMPGNGGVYLFTEPAGGWVTMTETRAIPAPPSFGYAVSLSGSTMVIGEPAATSDTGAAFVYRQVAGTWTQVAQLSSSDGTAGDMFGSSVSVFNTSVAIGAPGWPGGLGQGVAYLFNKPGGAWEQRAELTATDGAPEDHFGASIFVNGNLAAVGAPGFNAAYLFVQPGSESYSTQNAELTVNRPVSAFGASIGLSEETLVGGAPSSSIVYGFAEPAGGWQNMTQTWGIEGVGAELSPTSLAFAGQQVETSSPAQNVTLTNTGTATLAITSIAVSGLDSTDFSQTNTCGTSVSAGANCTISVTFTPSAAGSRSASLSITDDAPGTPQSVSLSGTGTAAVASLSPTSLSFGNQTLGSTSGSQIVTLTNTGNESLNISSVTTGADYAQTNNCGTSVAAGGSCSFSVTFTPTVAGTLNESLLITDNAAGSPQSVALSGTGVLGSPEAEISPSNLVFGDQVVGTTSASQSATVTNTGNAALIITSIVPTGDFALATTSTSCPYAGGTLNAAANCTIDVTFTPSASGSRTGSIAVTDNATGSPQTLGLTGTGIAGLNAIPSINFPVEPGVASPGAASVTLTVNGSGFVSGATVDWNGSPLATTQVNNEQLTATVPATDLTAVGTASITVVNPSPGGGASNAVFFPVTNRTSTLWLGRADWTTGNGPQWVGTGDLNGDGKPDLAVANSTDGTVSVLLGNGDGTFTSEPVVSVGPTPGFSAIADLNGDRIQDLAVADYANNTVAVLLGTGGGAFANPVSVSVGNGPVALALADFNADGALDLAVANNLDNTVSILLGNGDGTFSASVPPVSVGNGPVSIVAADFNADGIPDLAVANNLDGTLSILFGDGDGTFTSQPDMSLAVGLTSLVAADFNGDGLLDLAAANGSTNSISVLLGAGGGLFSIGAYLSTGNGPSALAAGDWNGDGIPDLAITNATDSTLDVLPGNGDGTFQAGITFGTGGEPVAIAAADFNDDGRLDAAVADLASGSISVLLQAPQAGLSPASLTFSAQAVGTQSSVKTVTLTNTGTAALTLASISITGTNTGDFTQTNACGGSVAAGGNCSISVTFTPTAPGSRAATLSVADNATGSPQTVSLSGKGTGPSVSFSPASLTFSAQKVGTTSPTKTLILLNGGNAALTISSITIAGADPSDFTETNTCPLSPSTLAAGKNCTFSVTFTPMAGGTRTASVSVADNASASPQSATLTGTATVVQLSPAGLGFGSIKVGKTSSGKMITLTNLGSTALALTSITITGTNSGDFSQTNTCGTSVGAGQACTITVTFTPLATGTRTASVSVSDSDVTSPQTAALSGSGS